MAYAGRRRQSFTGDPGAVRTRIRRLLVGLSPSAVVGAAADGADLLVLEVALALKVPSIRVVLPTTRAVFREDSVEPDWRHRFDTALAEVEQLRSDLDRNGRPGRAAGYEVTTLDLEPGEGAYRRANRVILDRAAGSASGDERVAVLVVAAPGEGRMVEDLRNLADVRGWPVLRIDPTVDISSRPKCFVAMPYGVKADPQRKIEVNCNAVYDKMLVPALENAQLDYERADRTVESGVILEPMIESLARADLMIADLQTGNFNVGWELGLRHLMRPGQTVLIGPTGTTPPFDVAALRHVRYDSDETGVSDDAAINAWGALADYLARAGERSPNDSPVQTVMEVQWGRVQRRSARDERWEDARRALALARDTRDADLMLEVVEDTDGFSTEQNRLLHIELGVLLVRVGKFREAQARLREVVEADRDVRHPDAHIYYAQSLYRPKDARPAALEEAEKVLARVRLRQPGHPEVRALLGAVIKRRLRQCEDRTERRRMLRDAKEAYRHDFERNLNLYYEGVNVLALDVALAEVYGDQAAADDARKVLPVVRFAAQLATVRPDERYWAEATIAECALHQFLLDGGNLDTVRVAYGSAGALYPPEGYLDSTQTQLGFLGDLGLPAEPLAVARGGLRQGAGLEV